ncbi:MAG: MFS transporter [Cellvibrionaceae bacterium]|nr:MFS transporter [Cellvibrionaceae bacterium]
MSTVADPGKIIEDSPMSRFQILAVAVCIFLYALDGFDVLAISFAAPGIASEWGVERGALGIVLSMELFGMALGSVFVGRIADDLGRRPTSLACLVIMAIGMALAALAKGIEMLSAFRFITGIGIGGMLAITTAMVAEYSNARYRYLCVTLMGAGYPMGAVLGGSVASVLLQHYEWRAVFVFGSVVTALSISLAWFFLPESLAFLCRKRPANALQKINKTLQRMGFKVLEALPELKLQGEVKTGFAELLSSRFIQITPLLCVAYFFHIMTFYFILKWIPKIVVDMGYSPSSAGGVLVWANVGGVVGAIFLGVLTQKIRLKTLVVCSMFLAAVLVWVFGSGQPDIATLSTVAAVAGFFTTSAVIGMYSIFTQYFPPEIRAGGVGFVIGVGRGGSALGPVIAGFLFQMGMSLSFVAVCMAFGSVIAAIAIMSLPKTAT